MIFRDLKMHNTFNFKNFVIENRLRNLFKILHMILNGKIKYHIFTLPNINIRAVIQKSIHTRNILMYFFTHSYITSNVKYNPQSKNRTNDDQK